MPTEHLNEFLDSFFEETTVNAEGNIQFKMWDFDHLLEILSDAFELPSKLTSRQKRRVVSQALLECRKADEKSEDALLKSVEKFTRAQLSKPFKHFTMWVKFRARQMAFERGFKFKWNGVSLRSAATLPKYLNLEEYYLSGHGG